MTYNQPNKPAEDSVVGAFDTDTMPAAWHASEVQKDSGQFLTSGSAFGFMYIGIFLK